VFELAFAAAITTMTTSATTFVSNSELRKVLEQEGQCC
jgi:spore coat protein CotF